MLFVLIVNAAEESKGSYQSDEENLVNEDLDLNGIVVSEQNLIENSNNNENNNNEKKESKPVTASFGVYLEIVG